MTFKKYSSFRTINVFKGTILIITFCFLGSAILSAQPIFKFNALADFELSKAGSKSHFYYNEIHENYIDWRFSVSQLNLIGQLEFKNRWALNTRLLLEREDGQKLERIKIPQLNLHWHSKKRKVGITIGNFINPFGGFNQKQLSTDRSFIGLPLAYSYYINISDKIGFLTDMGDITKVPVDGNVQWGSTQLYYGGYTTGGMFSWNIKPSKINWKVALVTGAPNLQKKLTDPIHFGIISKVKFQATYFWEQGVSVSHGSFLLNSEYSEQINNLHTFRQSLLGTDFKLGSGFLEFSGEVIAAFYSVPVFDSETLILEDNAKDFSSFSAYFDVKYEPSFLQGSCIAYRIDHMDFSNEAHINNQAWDNKILRHSFAIGYHFNTFILARLAVSTQQVDNKSWDKSQRTFRLVLTAHY